ncbi:MAG: carboxypeptidase-like regulatory domain-containing protein, partial [Chitinophagaceae bacterium]
MNKKALYYFNCCFLILLSLLTALAGKAQHTVSGSVTAADSRDNLIGVTVIVKGTSSGTSTDVNGKFALSNISSRATLVFSYSGFNNQEVAVNGQSVINVVLAANDSALQGVVVVGYGTQKKRNI